MNTHDILKEKIDRALAGTQMNYRLFDLAGTLAYYITNEIECLINGKQNDKNILKVIAIASDEYKVPLRSEVKSFFDIHKDLNPSTEILKVACDDWKSEKLDDNSKAVLEMIQIYIKILNELPKLKGEERKKYIDDYKEYIQNKEMITDIIKVVLSNYILSIDAKKTFEKVVKINSMKESIYEFMTNVDGINLMDRYSAKMLEGKIKLTSDRGYPNDETRPQQDAVLSIVKSNDIYLNVIADGAGGTEHGELASKKTIQELKNWFEQLNDKNFENIDYLIESLKEKINEISNEVRRKYEGNYSTVVLALTVKDKTIIMNVGDSTAYTYEDDYLTELSKMDLYSKAEYYEDARWATNNNMITTAIGDVYPLEPHINIIDNKGQRIILSSDGVTDLLSEDTFISYFKDSSSSEKIVDDALYHPETMFEDIDENGVSVVIRTPKQADNISAIVIDLPGKKKT